MATSQLVFFSSDGKQFSTALEADAHDLAKQMEQVVEAYIEHVGLGKAGAGLLRNHLAAFKLFEKDYQPKVTEPAEA